MAVIAALIAVRMRWRILRVPAGAVAAYLGAVLLLCKTLGALLYAMIAAPIVLLTKPRAWVKISCALLLLVCAYPMLRGAGVIPVERIASLANSVSTDRSASFETRVTNEKLLLAKASQKPWFGWGTWGRNRVYDQWTGKDVTITDGEWIIQFGTFGWLGYLSLFGLLTLAAFRALSAVGDQVTSASMVVGGLTLLLGVNAIDLLPNSNLTPLTWLVAGSITSAAAVRIKRTKPHRRTDAERSSVAMAQ
jgi:cell division protein FtsW (lipid II flippase)